MLLMLGDNHPSLPTLGQSQETFEAQCAANIVWSQTERTRQSIYFLRYTNKVVKTIMFFFILSKCLRLAYNQFDLVLRVYSFTIWDVLKHRVNKYEDLWDV